MKVLFFSPDTFGYYKKITAELELQGHEVDWHNHIQVRGNFDRVKARLLPKLSAKLSESFFNNQINWGKQYDVVLVIKGEGLSSGLLSKMRKKFTAARFVYYTWDSLSNLKGINRNFHFFDEVKSFDRMDCLDDKTVEYLPLFYSSDYKRLTTKTEFLYSCVFIGTLHSNRFEAVKSLASEIEIALKKPSFLFFFHPSQGVFSLQRLLDKRLRVIPREELSFEKLSSKEVSNCFESAEMVLDFNHTGQSGLTMRTIETVAMCRKLVTTNENVKFEPFFKPQNIFILGGENELTFEQFLAAPYSAVSPSLVENYSLSNWVRRLVG